jgi:cyclic pyranopterin phosphate synthase
MVDITEKPNVRREAEAAGWIKLKEETLQAIQDDKVTKGDVLATARVAALLAVKNTPGIIPMCHGIPITGIDVGFSLSNEGIEASVRVTSIGKTGVEMEALVGVSAALLTIWDMVKSIEKDESGNYPDTMISEVSVRMKSKSIAAG